MSASINNNPLFYQERLVLRSPNEIDTIVIHCTELPNLHLAREFGQRIHHQDTQTGNSGHFYIDRDGTIEQFVDPKYVAHHVIGKNASTIGIELVNNGRYPYWFRSDYQTLSDPYPDQQIKSLIVLIHQLAREYASIHFITGHEDLDQTIIPSEDDPAKKIKRKIDPGPLFPWDYLLANVSLQRVK